MKKVENVDDYIAAYPPATAKLLNEIRQIIRSAAPEGTEKISYGIPAYSLNRRLIYFGAFKNHISLFPASSTAIEAFKKDLAGYQTSRGTVRLPLDQPLPTKLIRRIVEFRVKELAEK
ncbi:MAG: DUF1801 domain-containing protein [Candidatus Saccharimonadales bacterium]